MKVQPRANPYLRAAKVSPAIRQQATQKLEVRLRETLVETMETSDGTLLERARHEDGTFKADDPSTPDVDEAWQPATGKG
jgi:hypothetical protein